MEGEEQRGKICFLTDDGEEVEFYVEEQARVNGTDYLLVSDSMEDDALSYIFKDTSGEHDEEAAYIPVEDETELKALAKVFADMLEGDAEIEGDLA